MNHLQDEPILSYSSTLFSLSTFRERFGEIAMPRGKKLPISGHRHVLSKRDIEVLIKWLARDQGVCVTDGEVGDVRFGSQSGPSMLGSSGDS